jgi:hypothetical protein
MKVMIFLKTRDLFFIVFVSNMSYEDFNWFYNNRPHHLKEHHVQYFSLPHPGSKWWNKKSKSYVNKHGESLSGKEKIVEVIREYGLF